MAGVMGIGGQKNFISTFKAFESKAMINFFGVSGAWIRSSALVFCVGQESNTPFCAIVTAMQGTMKVTLMAGSVPAGFKFGYKSTTEGVECVLFNNTVQGTYTNVVVLSATVNPTLQSAATFDGYTDLSI